MRPFSTLGWFALEMVGALELDRTTHPVMQAWALDAAEPIDKPQGNHMKVDHERGIVHVSSTPWPEEGSRAGGKCERLRQLVEKLKRNGKPIEITPQALLDRIRKETCPVCRREVPSNDIDPLHECCTQCYWELGD
jgi:hypothetical protein